MKTNGLHEKWLRAALFAAAIGLTGGLAKADIEIAETLSRTAGSTTDITGSGNAANTTSWSPGVAGQFVIHNPDTGFRAGLRVSILDPTGTLQNGTDSLMVAQTTNSQGLTDTGTLSIYFRPTGSNASDGAASVNGDWTSTILFESFTLSGSPGSFALTDTPLSVNVTLRSLDIDFDQKYYVQTAGFTHEPYDPTDLTTASPVISGFTGFTSSANSTFSDPEAAVTSKSTAPVDHFEAFVSHDSVALFMFEFRSNSAIVPEPSSSLVGLLGLGAVLGRRKRR
ncbi:MAG: PEP-CTERM sorting domain-containing protein [Verrucomicrobiota bacterium]